MEPGYSFTYADPEVRIETPKKQISLDLGDVDLSPNLKPGGI